MNIIFVILNYWEFLSGSVIQTTGMVDFEDWSPSGGSGTIVVTALPPWDAGLF